MRICALSFLFVLALISYGQDSRLDSLFEVFKNDIEYLQSFNDGIVVWDDDTREDYYLLINNSPIDTLTAYVNNSHGAIRCLIFSGLLNKTSDEELIKGIITRYMNDTTSFSYMSADVVTSWTVGEYLQTALTYKKDMKFDISDRLKEIRLTPRLVLHGERHGIMQKEDMLRIDSLIYNTGDRTIISFSMTGTKDTAIHQMRSASNSLTSAMKEYLRETVSGDSIYFEDINSRGPDDTVRRMGTIRLRVE